ncbi:CRISPR-associated endonuclease Cas3'' [Halanaeroarchaeum sulfurireducens]|uniref:CRISPR-associated protein Cas3 n=1 Tax=Halanaeroarchaeum sulfurireducens TaxID=1604004 RepID=A0A0F7PB33_9EURY|nr:CRISPR-associated endonuclease Cas3'' [Halanaeroarchaeum sulfurireducens]AKH97360.1 CRISPR-associated protein Cas3 [Halanaeroarchaeum sulfurireducens]ALG81762.1 CRISPR-associated protein Cas3 [Halanaeroarchaeum sulfurireducens]
MSGPFAHPPKDGQSGTPLVDHLEDVAERVDHVVPSSATTPEEEPLRPVVKTLAYVHDVGKATSYFQEYLLTDRTPDNELLRHHSPLGAFLAYYALKVRGFETETCLAGFVAVAKHHGSLPNIAHYVFDRAHRRDGVTGEDQNANERRQTAIARQIKDLDENNGGVVQEIVQQATDGEGSWSEFEDGFLDLLGDIETAVASSGHVPEPRVDALSDAYYGLVLQCWSSLVLADKTSAAKGPKGKSAYAPERPSIDRLDEHISDIESSVSQDIDGSRPERLNYYRSRAGEDVLDSVPQFVEGDNPVATLTLPTGMGKTLTGLSAALEIRDQSDRDRIVYALPFTSVIDQVVDELEDIYQTDTSGRLLTAHHHLAETTIQDVEDDDAADLSDDVASMLAESWRAGLTVTTFVQLFESLAGPANRQSMKLPALRNAVVVLDEPQSLPLDWWKLVPRLVELLTEQYNATVIAMTATQPRLFEDELELVDEPEMYFDAVSRVSYELDQSTERYITDQSGPKSYEAAGQMLRDVDDTGSSTLAICNTIDSARKLTEQVSGPRMLDIGELFAAELERQGRGADVDIDRLASRVEAADGRPLIHLSTRLRPVDRLTLIETAKRLTERSVPVLVVSTQLVEAGVDISFDRVYRDLAPIDSIVQAAGRCNRSFERDRGTVTVWWLDAPGDQSKTPAEAVYNRGTTLLPVVAETLERVREESGRLSETDVARRSVRQYFEQLLKDKNVGKQEYTDFVDDARGKDLGDLSLIDQRLSAEIVVARTPEERKLLDRIHEAQEHYDYETLNNLVEETKPLRISVPYYQEDSERASAIRDLPVLIDDQGVYELDVNQYEKKFDPTTGFVATTSSVDHQFL